MSPRVALVVGPTGATGKAIIAALARQGGWTVYGASRTAPAAAVGFEHLPTDLMQPGSLTGALSGREPVTHGFFCARAPFAEGGVEDVPLNVAMLDAMLDGLEATSPQLQHVHLIEGTKWYGMHLGPFRTPAREDDPRHLPPNFYYDQQDRLTERAQANGYGWVGVATRLHVRFLARAPTQSGADPRSLCGDLPRAAGAARLPWDRPGLSGPE